MLFFAQKERYVCATLLKYISLQKLAGLNMQNTIHADFHTAQQTVYEPSGFTCSNVVKEAESEEYGACEFEMNDLRIKFRVAKITPTKIGQFVTLWKRIGNGPIMPHDLNDAVDFFVVSVRHVNHLGQFVFPKTILHRQGIVSRDGKGGKRAIRVYPPWDITQSPQAKKTQRWQLKYFLEIQFDKDIDITNVKKLFMNDEKS
jgi:hypothetical protein